jgi:hypothetical protein
MKIKCKAVLDLSGIEEAIQDEVLGIGSVDVEESTYEIVDVSVSPSLEVEIELERTAGKFVSKDELADEPRPAGVERDRDPMGARMVTTGSIIHGTLLPQDLAPAWLSFLAELDPDTAKRLRVDVEYVVKDPMWEMTGDVLDELDDAINRVLPDGYWFGAHPGDSADFGVWEDEADDV